MVEFWQLFAENVRQTTVWLLGAVTVQYVFCYERYGSFIHPFQTLGHEKRMLEVGRLPTRLTTAWLWQNSESRFLGD